MKEYCTGLMLPAQRKSVEPLAAQLDPWHVSAGPCCGIVTMRFNDYIDRRRASVSNNELCGSASACPACLY
jgi:hypothetical protein